MVNMMAYRQNIKTAEPRMGQEGAKLQLPGWQIGVRVEAPYLSNTRRLEKGELLVLPFDAGDSELLQLEAHSQA